MARPRVFLSSTFYDLRQVRTDLERFIRDLGYDAILNERGNIPYGSVDRLEEYCYKEVTHCDILVSIIGGRFGTQSQQGSGSISQMEVETALKNNKQVYIFVEQSVLVEFHTYLVNKDNPETKYSFVDDVKVFEYLAHLQSLPNNNPIHPFESAQDIIQFLREQWAGLFQRYLQDQARIKEISSLKSIESIADTLKQLVNFLTEERVNKDQAIQDILLSNHPAMTSLRELLGVKYRVYFTNKQELKEWLSARSYIEAGLDQYSPDELNVYDIWIYDDDNQTNTLKIKTDIFQEDGKLKPITPSDWSEDKIIFNSQGKRDDLGDLNLDDLPF